MCGRFTLAKPGEIVQAVFGLDAAPRVDPHYNIAPTQSSLVIRAEPGGGRRAEELRWGLVPEWGMRASIGSGMINARAETLAEKPMFAECFEKRRCLVPADGFYEWTKAGKQRQGHHIRRVDRKLFAFAGLWERDTFTIVTTDANDVLRPVHHRMPAILPAESWIDWLDPDRGADEELGKWLAPAPEDWLEVYPVGPAVNNVSHDDPSLIDSADPEASPQLSLDL